MELASKIEEGAEDVLAACIVLSSVSVMFAFAALKAGLFDRPVGAGNTGPKSGQYFVAASAVELIERKETRNSSRARPILAFF